MQSLITRFESSSFNYSTLWNEVTENHEGGAPSAINKSDRAISDEHARSAASLRYVSEKQNSTCNQSSFSFDWWRSATRQMLVPILCFRIIHGASGL